jgi:hypothetical protein
MSVILSPIGNSVIPFFTNTGMILDGGLLYTYQAGSTTPLATYTDNTGTILNTNPIIIGTNGIAPFQIWLTDGVSYKFVLEDSAGSTLQTYDNIYGIPSATSSSTNIPSGGIIMWSGSIGSIPSGYVICNGLNSTPNLQDCFIVGSGNDFAVGNTGGFATAGVVTSAGVNKPLYYSLAYIMKT